jgi:ATP-dependent protease HslVU (ClpYQ) peptidase subunit
MSTIVVVRKDGTAVIGADTLTKLGYTCESAEYIRHHSKIIKVGQNFIGVVGHASGGLVMASYFSSLKTKVTWDSQQSIFEMARTMHTSLKDDYFLNPTEDTDDPFESSQFSCLIANQHGIFGLYALRSVQEYTKFYAFGSGYKFALGAMHAVYNSKMTASQIAKAGLSAAAEFDDATGSPLEIKTVQLKRA